MSSVGRSTGSVSPYKSALTDVFNRNASGYDRSGLAFFTPIGRRLVEHVAPDSGETVLDVGCGMGACLFPVAEAVGPGGRAVGIDLADRMVDAAAQEARRRGFANVEIRCMDADEPSFPGGSFDAVLGAFSFVLLERPLDALARYRPLLRGRRRLGIAAPVFTTERPAWPYGSDNMVAVLKEVTTGAATSGRTGVESRIEVARWLSTHATISEGLATAGFGDVHVVDEDFELTMRTGREMVAWSYTQGMRLFWESHGEARRAELEDALEAEAEALRGPDGWIRVAAPIRYILAEGRGD